MKSKYKFLEHTADVKFQAYGSSLKEAFVNSAYALKETIAGKIKIKSQISKEIKVKGKDNEALLYNFLEEFLFLLDSEGFLFSKIKKINIIKGKLICDVAGDNARNYKFTNDVKAVTYNQMFVKKIGNKFVCQVVLDV
jgi:SHS2 domain-containing protein